MPRHGADVALVLAIVLGSLVIARGATGSVSAKIVATPPPPRTVKIMTWNVCGNQSRCRYYRDPAGLVDMIRWQMLNSEGGRIDAALLQEVCRSFVKPLERQLERHDGRGWTVRFAPSKINTTGDPTTSPNVQCASGRGDYGVALALPDESTWWGMRYLPSPRGDEWRVAICATVDSWLVKLCNTHLSHGRDDPTGRFRSRQIAAYEAYVRSGRLRVIFGGDLNRVPPKRAASGALAALYDSYLECAQADQGSPRAGPGTYYTTARHDNARTIKIDYLFTTPGTRHSCDIPSYLTESSDHRPMWLTVAIPRR